MIFQFDTNGSAEEQDKIVNLNKILNYIKFRCANDATTNELAGSPELADLSIQLYDAAREIHNARIDQIPNFRTIDMLQKMTGQSFNLPQKLPAGRQNIEAFPEALEAVEKRLKTTAGWEEMDEEVRTELIKCYAAPYIIRPETLEKLALL